MRDRFIYGKLTDKYQSIILVIAVAFFFPTLFINNIYIDIALLLLGVGVFVSSFFHLCYYKRNKSGSGIVVYILYGLFYKKINSFDISRIDFAETEGKQIMQFVLKNDEVVNFYSPKKGTQNADRIQGMKDWVSREQIENFYIQEKIFDYKNPEEVPKEFRPYYYLVWIDCEVDSGGYWSFFHGSQWGMNKEVIDEISKVAPSVIVENFIRAKEIFLELGSFNDLFEKSDFDYENFQNDYPTEYKKYIELEKEMSDCDTEFYEHEQELLAKFEEFDKNYRAQKLEELSKKI